MIFISGPWSIDIDFFKRFETVAEHLKEQGYDVYNPANRDRIMNIPIDIHSMDKIIEEDLLALLKCDSIFLMSGWEFSPKCHLELKTAKDAGIKVIREENEK